MPFDPKLDERLANALKKEPGIERKKMFGGTGYMLNGNMCVGVYKDLLVLRVGDECAKRLLTKPFVRLMDITGRPMKGWVMIEAEGCAEDKAIKNFIKEAIAFVSTLPPK